jgi:hypothetical protein
LSSSRARGALLLVLALCACEFEKVGIPRTDSRIALHAVLSASASSQVVLLERTRNGSVTILSPPFDLVDPVMTDEGIAEPNASVRMVTPAGDTLAAVEDHITRGDGKGRGIYRFFIDGSALVRGAAYRLLVRTTRGETLSAETAVPEGAPDVVREVRVFDRASEVVELTWPAVSGARSYFVRVESPWGPRSFFTDSTHIRLAGALRNVDVEALPRMFIPGFPQGVTVSAVDLNYYDWYRSQNNALTGTGLINRVDGGFGLFGSLVRLHLEEFEVVEPQSDPVEGVFRFDGTAAEQSTTPYLSWELYIESPAARSDQGAALSGRYHVRPRFGYTGCLTCGLLGTVKNGQVELAFLRDWTARDTVETFSGELRGDTIVGSYRGFGDRVRFRRQP